MKDEIKEILDDLDYTAKKHTIQVLENGGKIEHCPQEIETELRLNTYSANILLDYITNLQEENERLKKLLNCKEYFSATMPENTEFVILTKNNYDRLQKDIQLDLIDCKSRIENATVILNNIYLLDNVSITNNAVEQIDKAINILQGVGKDE